MISYRHRALILIFWKKKFIRPTTGMEIYKRNILGEKVRKHAFDQEKKVISKEKGRKHELDQEKKEIT